MEPFLQPDSEPPHRPMRHILSFPPIRIFVFLAILAVCVSAALGADSSVSTVTSASWLAWGGLAGFVGSVLFTILDLALFALDSEEIEGLGRVNPRAGTLLRNLRRDLNRTWFTLLSGTLLSNLLFALAIGGWVIGILRAPWGIRFAVSALVALVVVLVFGQVLPGLLAARWLKEMVPFSARCVRFASFILWPLYIIPLSLLNLVSAIRASSSMHDRSLALEAEKRLLVLVGVGQVDVSLEEEEREMIDHAIEFGENTAGHFMTPRSEIEAIETATSHEEVLERLRRIPFTRLVVYNHSLDNVEGLLHSKQVLLNPDSDYHQFIVSPLFVPEDMPLIDLLVLMKGERRQIVVVLDEYGGTAGIVSMNDLLVELVGGKPDEEENPETTNEAPAPAAVPEEPAERSVS